MHQFISELRDGHCGVDGKKDNKAKTADLAGGFGYIFSMINNKLTVVYKFNDVGDDLELGDVVVKIND